jgi:hypothetical protein
MSLLGEQTLPFRIPEPLGAPRPGWWVGRWVGRWVGGGVGGSVGGRVCWWAGGWVGEVGCAGWVGWCGGGRLVGRLGAWLVAGWVVGLVVPVCFFTDGWVEGQRIPEHVGPGRTATPTIIHPKHVPLAGQAWANECRCCGGCNMFGAPLSQRSITIQCPGGPQHRHTFARLCASVAVRLGIEW